VTASQSSCGTIKTTFASKSKASYFCTLKQYCLKKFHCVT
jgi:hypothetical protein